MAEYTKHFNKVLEFINEYHQLINCHLVDFITQNLWESCLPNALKSELENIEIHTDEWMQDNKNLELNKFLQLTELLSLKSCPAIMNLTDIVNMLDLKEWENDQTHTKIKTEFMNGKKSHEVEVLGKIVGKVAESTNSLIIDAGAGKAYLSTYLSENYGAPVLAIDSSKSCYKGAIHRREKIQRKKKQLLSVIEYAVEEINDQTNYNEMLKQHFPNWICNRNLILTGLHTCGTLACSVLKAFLNTEDIHFLCVVPCCYHLMSESISGKYNFSKNARMLAQQSIERSAQNKSMLPSLFYRAVLQVVLHSLGLYNVRVGRGGPLNDFSSYAKWGLRKIGVESEKMPSTEKLQAVYEEYAHLKEKFDVFQILRIRVSPVIEAAILLDKIIFLLNSGRCSNFGILRLFDPALSPRCYAIVATK